MASIRERRIELGGVRSRALELDGTPAAGPPLVLLHGWADSADTWRTLMRQLARAGRSAIALDMPGFGQAARLDRERTVLPQLDRFAAAAVRRQAERTGSEVVVVGNSLGGAAAMRVAERPELPIAGVVPVAPAGLDMAQWMSIIEGERALSLLLRAPLPVPEIIVREVVGRVYRSLAFARPVDPAVVSSFTRHLPTRRDGVRVLATGRQLRNELQDPFRLEKISCPLLIVWGELDRMVFPTGADRVLETVPDSRLVRIPGCGHCPQIECPELLAGLLEEFPDASSEDLAKAGALGA
jgi:pimeloyl-ACP methyl ester carboxylesterase